MGTRLSIAAHRTLVGHGLTRSGGWHRFAEVCPPRLDKFAMQRGGLVGGEGATAPANPDTGPPPWVPPQPAQGPLGAPPQPAQESHSTMPAMGCRPVACRAVAALALAWLTV